ncbi:MAG: hypothetical protein HZC49_09115 [Nitrospirae bacterium]|nr:hypothetical protein [Nitrospirota bacterium]
MEIDFTSQHIVQLVKSAVDLVEKGQSENVSKEYMEYASEIITELLERPGQLVYIAYPDFIRKAEDAINIIWGNVDDDELFQEIFYGKIHGESRAAIIADDYMKRAKKLRPTFLTKKPKEAISAYFQNAMECWLFGINTAALILCCSVIESLLTDAFEEKGLSLTKENGRPKGFLALTYEANKESIIDGNIKEMADDINELRRLAVHHISEYHTENIGETETYNAIMKTKKIIEKLLT